MPERRIDAIAKTEASAWNAAQSSKNPANPVKVLSGTLSQFKTGEVMQSVVQKASNGAFKITLNGETFIIKGLPGSLVGKEVAFMTQKSMLQGKMQTGLFWVGANQTKHATKQTRSALSQQSTQQSAQQSALLSARSQSVHSQPKQKSSQQANILSSLPASLKTGTTAISARLDNVLGKHMQISMTIQDGNTSAQSTRHQLLTSTIPGLKIGQQFHATIQTTANQQPTLNILSQPAQSSKMAQFKLSPGDTTAAIVQKRLPNGLIQLNIQGTQVETAAPANIAKGDLLTLRLNKAPAEFQLLAVQKNTADKALAAIKANLTANNPPLHQNISSIRNLATNLTETTSQQTLSLLENALKASESSTQSPLDGKRLAHMIQHAGTSLEAKLLNLSQNPSINPTLQQDLKAIMLQLLQSANTQDLNNPNNKLLHQLTELSQKSLARIESGQALNVLAHIQGEPIRLELPMLVNQQLINVQLSMQQHHSQQSNQDQQNGESSKQEQSYSILFALELSQLGNIRVDANISDNSVHARIYNANPASNQFILEHMPRLEERLQSLGFEKVYIISSQQQPTIDKQQRFDQLKQMMPAPSSLNLLDIRI